MQMARIKPNLNNKTSFQHTKTITITDSSSPFRTALKTHLLKNYFQTHKKKRGKSSIHFK